MSLPAVSPSPLARRGLAFWPPAAAIALFQVVGSLGAADNQPERRGIDAVALALVLAGPAALAFLRRQPLVASAVSLAAAALYLARGHAYGPIFVSVVVALFLAVQDGQRRAAWAMAAAGYGAFVLATVVDPRADDVGWVHWALVAGWLVVVLTVSDVVRARRQQLADAQRRRVEEQRLRIAQEVHDVLAHNISLINVQASVALHLLDQQPEQARPALTTIKAASREALVELRTALDALRQGDGAAPRTPAPRLDDLGALVATVRSGGLDVRFESTGEPVATAAATELAAYRIVQEALTNVVRHARATTAVVRVAHDPEALTVEVRDDGSGGPVTPGNGITGMRERAASLGGTVEVGPAEGGGFRVRARLPVRP